jgi:site-specific recombinase XerD
MDPFTLHVLAGHTDMNTTKRYVHPSEADIREAMAKVQHSLEQCAGIGRNAFNGPMAVV